MASSSSSTSSSEVRRFLGRAFALSLPLVALLASYVVLDPFKVVRHHDQFYGGRVMLDRDYVATEIFLAQDPREHYDSFVLGSSRTLALLCDDWRPYLPAGASPFHFDASGESLFGIWSKLRFLHARNNPLRNVLVLVDEAVLTGTLNTDHHLFIKHPLVSGESRLAFQRMFFTAYFSNLFAIRFLDWSLFHQSRPYMEGMLDERGVITQLPRTNDLLWTTSEAEIAARGEGYWETRARVFTPRAARRSEPLIGPRQREMLEEMRAIFQAHGTSYRIIGSPRYEHVILAAEDVRVLGEIFGAENVDDESGDEALTSDVHYWYEASHFRPTLGRILLARAYAVRR